MYTSIVTINESVIICMYVHVFMTRNCTVYDNKIYVLFEIAARMSQSVHNFKFKEC